VRAHFDETARGGRKLQASLHRHLILDLAQWCFKLRLTDGRQLAAILASSTTDLMRADEAILFRLVSLHA